MSEMVMTIRHLRLTYQIVRPSKKKEDRKAKIVSFEYGNDRIHISINNIPYAEIRGIIAENFMEDCTRWLYENRDEIIQL